MSDDRALADLDAEREVDLRSWWGRIVNRWWLPVGGALAGAVLGVLVSLGGDDVYEASTLLYVGQPFAPNGGGQIQSLQTNPKTVSEIVRSESVRAGGRGRRRACVPASCAGTSRPRRSRRRGSRERCRPCRRSRCRRRRGRKAEAAANALAGQVIEVVSPFVARKVELLERADRAPTTRGIEAANKRIADALRAAAGGPQRVSLAHRPPADPGERQLDRCSSTRRV